MYRRFYPEAPVDAAFNFSEVSKFLLWHPSAACLFLQSSMLKRIAFNVHFLLQVVQSLKVPVSAAAIQGHFMQHKEDPLGALDNASSL